MSSRIFQAFALVALGALGLPRGGPGQRFATFGAGAVSPAQNDNASGAGAALNEAQAALDAGRLDEALAACREALRRDGRSAPAYYLLGLIEIDEGRDAEASQALLRSVDLGPSYIPTHVELGKLYVRAKQWHVAEQQFRTALRLGDASGTSDFGLALALVRQSRLPEALPHLARAVRADPKDPEKLMTLIAAEFQMKRTASAERHLAQIEKLAPRDAGLFHQLGNILHQNQRLDESERLLEQSAELLAAGGGESSGGLTLAGISLEIAWVRFEQGNYEGALRALEKLNWANAPAAVRTRALDMEGNSLLALGRIDEARARLGQAMEADPAELEYALHAAWAALMAGDLEGAARIARVGKSRWPQDPQVSMLMAVLDRERLPERRRIPLGADWHLKGEGLVCCPCAVPCPCRSNGPPTHPHCENTGVYRIAQGRYAGVRLDGLTFASVEAAMNEGNVPSTIYVDQAATDEQLIALERIYQSFKPLQPFVLLSVKRVPLALVSPDHKTYSVNVPGLLEIKIRRQFDDQGKPLLQTAALDFFSNRIEYARNLVYKVWNPNGGLKWDYSGRQANFRTMDLSSRDYRDQTMLIQFADGSGFFNRKQRQLIKSLMLPTLRSSSKPAGSASNEALAGPR